MTINNTLKPKAIVTELARRIKEYRISAEITQKELADIAMVSNRTLTRFENGEDISLEKAIRILSALGLTDNIGLLVPDPDDSPIFHSPQRTGRKRARKKEVKKNDGWVWGEDK